VVEVVVVVVVVVEEELPVEEFTGTMDNFSKKLNRYFL
jgi:hypothetical protein